MKPTENPLQQGRRVTTTVCVEIESALKWSVHALQNAGVEPGFAEIQARHLVSSEIRGHPSHGLLRLPRLVERISNGVASPNAKGIQTWKGSAFLHVDGDRGLGPVVMKHTMDALKAKLGETGVAMAAIDNCNHMGRLAHFAESAAAEGLVSIFLTTSEALVHPHGGRKAMVGTNPIALGVPADPSPFVIDLATSKISMGKVHAYADADQQLEEGWAIDVYGSPTTNPELAKSGALAPFGEAKGYALGLAFEVLIGALADSALGPDVRGTLDSTEVCNKGDLVILARPHSSAALRRVGRYLDDIRAVEPFEPTEPVRIPGDGVQQRIRDHEDVGLMLPAKLADELRNLAIVVKERSCD